MRSTATRSRARPLGYTRQLGYHPLAAVRSDTGAVLHIRNQGQRQHPARRRLVIDELLARVHRAGHAGTVIIRADSGFENHKLMAELARRGVEFSIGVKQSQTIRALIEQIPETGWVTIAHYPDTGQAQIAETQLGA